MSTDFADRARALVGTPFRPQGRCALGLDCVGLAIATYGMPADSVRRDYRLRGDHLREVRAALAGRFRRVLATRLRSGDLMLMKVADDQLHLAVRTRAGFVHAHAQLRRVVETPGMPQWTMLGVYRFRKR